MCLSTVYNKSAADDNLLCRNIMKIDVQGDQIKLTDIMQTETDVVGRIVSADLVNGVVIVDCQA